MSELKKCPPAAVDSDSPEQRDDLLYQFAESCANGDDTPHDLLLFVHDFILSHERKILALEEQLWDVSETASRAESWSGLMRPIG